MDVAGSGSNQRCGLVRSTATASAAQLLEPFEALLRIQMVSVLRRVINEGELMSYFPSTCLLE